jgi:Ca-activated chloride channel family protein
MTLSVTPMGPAELDRAVRPDPEAGFGVLLTDRGNLPLDRLDVRAAISGLVAHTTLTTEFVNTHPVALEATYVFPLNDRAAVTGMTMTADGRTVTAELQERSAAREAYDQAIASGRRASIAEEERPDVFTMRVGNIAPGERVSVQIQLVGPLPWQDGAATYRFPLVVAPRYIPGAPLDGPSVGDGHATDTDAVPDASRISPPVLLPGCPSPVRLSIGVDIDAAGLTLGDVRSSLHTVTHEGGHVEVLPGERADRDFVLRLAYAGGTSGLICVPDGGPGGEGGTYQLTVLPPGGVAPPRPRDVVLLLDRSGSMSGWSMVAARRAAARIVDTLTDADRFAVLSFDDRIEHPAGLGTGLVTGTDRHRYRAVEHLARVEARGGTELLAPLRRGLALLADAAGAGTETRDRVLVLVTDGQVGNEDQILHDMLPLVGPTRVHTVGIDQAVNAGFLGRLASLGAGRCELVESEDRLDDAMEHIQRRIGGPVVTGLTIDADEIAVEPATRTPARLSGLYPGVPLVVSGRYAGSARGALTVRGRTRDDRDFSTTVPVQVRADAPVAAIWARAHLRDLEDRYATGSRELESTIVATSLTYSVLCRFTAWLAVDTRVVTEGGTPHRVVQPVELPAGWEQAEVVSAGFAPQMMRVAGAMPPGAVPYGGPTRGMMRARQSSPHTPLREILAVEAGRLRDADGRPAPERRELLADLVSRLATLLHATTDPEFEPLRELVASLTAADGPAAVDALWQRARQVLDAFTTGTSGGRRTAFWKR